MMATTELPIYDELLDLFAASAATDLLLLFRLSSQRQARLDGSFKKNRENSLAPDERGGLRLPGRI